MDRTDNVYAPPASDIVEPAAREASDGFYVVAPFKFCLLFFGTLGLYQLYWFYMQWARYRRRSGDTVWPVARTIFAIFFTHSLAGRMDEALRARGERYDWSPGGAASVYVIAQVVSGVCDRLSAREIGSPLTDLVSIALLVPAGLGLLRLQHAANRASGDPLGESNRRLTKANYAWLAVGALLWSLMVLGLVAVYVLEA